MKVKLPIVWTEDSKLNDEDNEKFNALGQEPELDKERSYAIIDLKRVESWYPLKDNTILKLKSGSRYEVEVPEEVFTSLYSKMTLEIIGEIEIKLDEDEEPDI